MTCHDKQVVLLPKPNHASTYFESLTGRCMFVIANFNEHVGEENCGPAALLRAVA